MILSSWLFPSIGDEEGESRLFPTWAKKSGSLGRSPSRRGCGHNYLNQCCIPGAKLPLYAFRKLNVNDDDTGLLGHKKIEPPVAFLDSLLLREWEDSMQRGLFRYDVTACETKVIPGQFGFIAQLNEGRHLKKRPTEFRVDKVLQPFDGSKFNFTKVEQDEVMF